MFSNCLPILTLCFSFYSLGGWVIESAPMRIPPSILANDVKHELLALLEGMMDEEALKSAAESAVLEYKGLDAAALLDDEQKDYIVDLQVSSSRSRAGCCYSARTFHWSAVRRTVSSVRTVPVRRRC